MATDQPPLNDPFAALDGQRTFIKPNPGGWPGSRTTLGGALGSSVIQLGSDNAEPAAAAHGLNPLVAAANPLLMLAHKLRHTKQVQDVGALRASLVQGVRDFATGAQTQGIAPERVMAARYVLCTLLDEAAADTPWGGGGAWARHSLLAEFHNESFGGEKVFQLMARLAEKPDANRDLLELIYAALALGFEGRYRVVDGGKAQLEAVRARLAQVVRQQQGSYPPALAQRWAGTPVAARKALGWLPLAVAAAGTLLLLGLLYAAFAWSLSGRADPVFNAIQQLRLSPPVAPVALPAPQPRLAQFLQPDIKAGLVAVRDEVDRSVVVIRGDGLFASASDVLAGEREALIQRIGEALVRVPGPVLVTGHTDNQAIRGSIRFPSNWHLSDARADTVKRLLQQAGVPTERMRAEGRADGEPVDPKANNDLAENRAKNRRVEITLMANRPDAVAARPPAAAPTAPTAAPAAPAASR
jgi:type VI secretion system protein ImpK